MLKAKLTLKNNRAKLKLIYILRRLFYILWIGQNQNRFLRRKLIVQEIF